MTFSATMLGGPQDGNTYALEEDAPYVRFAQMKTPLQRATKEPSPYETVAWDYIHYTRTKRFSENGARIYEYDNG